MSEKLTVRITNWREFQHYKDRYPPWIKLHRTILDNRQWALLSGDAAKALIGLWLVAAGTEDGIVEEDIEDLSFKLRLAAASDVQAFASSCLAWLQELADKGFVSLDDPDALADARHLLADAVPEERRGEKRRGPKKKNSFPEGWEPQLNHHARAKEEGVDVRVEAEKFENYAISNSKTFADWDRAFTNWLIRAGEYAKQNPPKPTGSDGVRPYVSW